MGTLGSMMIFIGRWLVEGFNELEGGNWDVRFLERNVDFMWYFFWGGFVVNEVVNP